MKTTTVQRAICYFGTSFLVSSCFTSYKDLTEVPEKEPDSRKNQRWAVEVKSQPDYESEMGYVRERRVAAGVRRRGTGKAVGLAFSGGGIRSATINLGVLQQLQNEGLLQEVDYLSAVSGGAYIASWYVSFLTKPNADGTPFHTMLGHSSDPSDVLADGEPAVSFLRENRNFVVGRNGKELPGILATYLATLPVNLVMDVALHLKIPRGKMNWHHPNHFYGKRIRDTYLRRSSELLPGQLENYYGGKGHEVGLDEINPSGSRAPLLIINSAMVNNRPENWTDTESQPFEFGRFSCGSPSLGFVPASHFGMPVEGTYMNGEGKRMTVMRSNSFAGMPVTKPFRLSKAVAASGAALDANGIGVKVNSQCRQKGEIVNPPVVTTNWDRWELLLKPFNLNLRHHNRNFAMAITSTSKEEPYRRMPTDWNATHDFRDRLREVTKDRAATSVYSNSLILTDGGHYDNLGVFTLTQREDINEIWSIDAGADPGYEFDDLVRLEKILYYAGWDVNWKEGRTPHQSKPMVTKGVSEPWTDDAVFEATLTRSTASSKRSIRFFYVKSSYRNGDGVTGRDRAYLKSFRHGTNSSGKDANKTFPHITTAKQFFNEWEFNAYQKIGKVFGKQLAAERRK